MKTLSSTKVVAIVISALVGTTLISQMYVHRLKLEEFSQSIIEYREETLNVEPIPTVHIPPPREYEDDFQEVVETVITEPTQSLPNTALPNQGNDKPWGVAEKVDDVTYTIKVGYDDSMASPQEILGALNQYRAVHGVSALAWDDKLGNYAQSRANHFNSIGGTDKHAGFDSYLESQSGFTELGFNRLGENSFFGGPLSGTHLIEWVFSQSPGHNANQLDSGWTHVGIGVTQDSVNLNFGSGQI